MEKSSSGVGGPTIYIVTPNSCLIELDCDNLYSQSIYIQESLSEQMHKIQYSQVAPRLKDDNLTNEYIQRVPLFTVGTITLH